MAVGRRKRFGGSNTMPTPTSATLFTAGAAPADGSAAASFKVLVCNTTGGTVIVTLLANGVYCYQKSLVAGSSDVTDVIDLMGAEVLQGFANMAGVSWTACGVEAKDV